MKKKIRELQAKRAEAIKAARAILDQAEKDERALTDEERAKLDEHQADAERLGEDLEREERQARLDKGLEDDPPAPSPDPNPNPSPAPKIQIRSEGRPFSLMRAIRASMEKDWSLAKDEKRVSDELAEFFGVMPRGFLIPVDALLSVREQTAFHRKLKRQDPELLEELERREIGKVAPTTAGAGLVATNLLVDRLIEVLRPELVTARLGADVIPGLVGDVDIPRQATASSAGWIATEGGDAAESQLTTDTLSLSPKTVALRTLVTRRMLLQATPAIEERIRRDQRRAIAEAIDAAAIAGDGTGGAPVGILSTAGIGSVTVASSPDWPKVVEFETDLAEANALRGSLGWAFRPAVKAKLKTTVKESGEARFLMDEQGNVNGYPSVSSAIVPATTGIFGNWNELILGFWGMLDAFADPYTKGDSGGLVLRSFQDADVGVAHPASFSAATDF